MRRVLSSWSQLSWQKGEEMNWLPRQALQLKPRQPEEGGLDAANGMDWDSGCSRVGCAPKWSGLWFRLYLYAEQFRHFYLVTVPEFYLILVLPCFPSKSSLYVLTAGWYLKEMYLPSMLVNGDGDTVSKFRVSRRKLRKQLIYPALALGKSLY